MAVAEVARRIHRRAGARFNGVLLLITGCTGVVLVTDRPPVGAGGSSAVTTTGGDGGNGGLGADAGMGATGGVGGACDGPAGGFGPGPGCALRIDAGEVHVCAIESDGTLWCWGANWDGAFGDGKPPGEEYAPVQAAPLGACVRQVALGGSFGCALRYDASHWCSGANLWLGEANAFRSRRLDVADFDSSHLMRRFERLLSL